MVLRCPLESHAMYSQNCRGLKTDARVTELLHSLGTRGAFATWHELAANRGAWREMLRWGEAPPEFRPRPPSPPPPPPEPLARTKPKRACAAKTTAAIDAMPAADKALRQLLSKPTGR